MISAAPQQGFLPPLGQHPRGQEQHPQQCRLQGDRQEQPRQGYHRNRTCNPSPACSSPRFRLRRRRRCWSNWAGRAWGDTAEDHSWDIAADPLGLRRLRENTRTSLSVQPLSPLLPLHISLPLPLPLHHPSLHLPFHLPLHLPLPLLRAKQKTCRRSPLNGSDGNRLRIALLRSQSEASEALGCMGILRRSRLRSHPGIQQLCF